MQITATVSTKTSTYESNSTQIIVIDYPNAQHPPTPKSEPLVKHTESDPSGPLMDTKPIIFDYQPSYSSGIYGSYVVTPALIPDTHLGKSKSLAIAKRTASDTSEPPIDTTLNMTNVECTTQDPLNPTQHLGKSKSLVIVKRTASDRKSFEYKPSYSSGIYGSYVVTRALLHSTMYRASFSSGVYGSYLFSCHVSNALSDAECKEKECLDSLFEDLLRKNKNDIDAVNRLKRWINEKKMNCAQITHDVVTPNTSEIQLFDPQMFTQIAQITKTKRWKRKQKEIMLISTAKLWDVVDDGVINIWCSDVVAIEIAIKY